MIEKQTTVRGGLPVIARGTLSARIRWHSHRNRLNWRRSRISSCSGCPGAVKS